MELLYRNLEEKFERILSGTCLTSFRDENARIIKKYDCFDESELTGTKQDFRKYVSNYLFLKGYDSVHISESNDFVTARNGEGEFTFFIDFDRGGNDGSLSVKVLDKGAKCGISNTDAKYVFIISIEKRLMVLMNCENLKSYVKEKKPGFGMLTETDSLFKSQYVTVDLNEGGRKARVFSLK
jgi:hypothetical protein